MEDDLPIDKKSIVIAEDSTIMREALRALISSDPDLHVIAEAKDGKEALELVEKLKPDLMMDLSMPRTGGMDVIREIHKRIPETKVVVLTIHNTEEYVFGALKAGAQGYVLKDATHADLMMALHSVLAGKRYLSPGVSQKVVEGYISGGKTLKPKTRLEHLSRREREIIKLIAEGYRNKQIAEYLSISVKTVETHRANLMRKLDLHSARAITAFAMEKGLVSREQAPFSVNCFSNSRWRLNT